MSIHEETASQLLERSAKGEDLLGLLAEMDQRGLKVISLDDRDQTGKTTPLSEIDPFTFLATFNRGIKPSHRVANWTFLKDQWNLTSPVPDDFHGIPVVHNMQSWFFPFAASRVDGHVKRLWTLAEQAVRSSKIDRVDENLFNQCAALPVVGFRKLTIGLFWINPTHFLPADKKTVRYGESKGVTTEPKDFRSYCEWTEVMTSALGTQLPRISHDAHLAATKGDDEESEDTGRRFWLLATGKEGREWEMFRTEGIATIGWDGTPDLRNFATKNDIKQYLQNLEGDLSSKKHAVLACWQFVHDVRPGDVVFAKQGVTTLLGHGVVTSDYRFDPARTGHRHLRLMNWLSTGEWHLPGGERFVTKTLTDITDDEGLVSKLAAFVGLDMKAGPAPSSTAKEGKNYWWLNANPKIWDLAGAPVGTLQTYTSHNEKGNKRQKFRYFEEIKSGDFLVGYVTSPDREIVAICRITKGLHRTDQGDAIEFEKIEQVSEPVPYASLQASPDLADSEPVRNNQGSLFRLTEREYEIIRGLIDDLNVVVPTNIQAYSRGTALDGLFLSETAFDDMLLALREKKNIVLQGAPGVGKTFLAKRLAYAFIGSSDPSRVQLIQFHQSYSYEDFVQGFRPTAKGHFELTPGLFYQFCRRAQRHEADGTPYVLIIDEINRGNLSKIFGELMMLVESDKRGKSFSMPLAYAQDQDDTFFVPANLFLIGMMNTADRSLAMVDYALRRRFRFITLRPEFGSDRFQRWLVDSGAERALVNKILMRMQVLNETISADSKNLGPGYQVGHSYFCPQDGIRPDEAWYRRVVESEIVPLLQEYWFDDEQKVEELRKALLD